MSGPTARRDLAIALTVVIAVLLGQLPLRLRTVSLVDEGAILQIAEDIREGRHPYADAVHYAFPGVFYLTAAAFALGGTSVETARTLAAAVFAVAAALVFLMARWSHSRRGALAVAAAFVVYRVFAYPHWQMLSYSTLAVTVALGATWLTGEALARSRPWAFVIAGAAAGAAIFAKQDSGLAATAALGVGVLVCAPGRRLAAAAAFAAGTLLVLSGGLAAMASAGFARDLVRETLVAPLYGVTHFAYLGRPALRPLLHQDPWLRSHVFSYFPPVLVDLYWPAIDQSRLYRDTAVVDVALKLAYHLPWIVLLAGLVPLVRGRAPDDVARQGGTLLWLLALAFVAAFTPPRDWVHLLVLYPPTLLLGARLLAPALRRSRPLRAAGGVVLAALLALAIWLGASLCQAQSTPVRSARGVLYASAPQAASLQAVLDALAGAPSSAPLAALPYHPLLDFLAARRPLTRHYVLWPVDPSGEQEAAVIRGLEEHPEALVVYSPTQVPHFPRFADYAGSLFDYLTEHFTIVRSFGGDIGGYAFLLLGRERPPRGRSLLGPVLDAASVAIERRDGRPAEVTPAERARLAGEARWPFSRVLRVATVPEGSVTVAYRLTPAAGERFETRYGLDPDRWSDFPALRVRFAVAVRPADGDESEVFAAEVDPFREPTDRRWAPLAIDLSPWADRPLDLVLRVTGPPRMPRQLERAGWADPRLVGAR